MTLELSKDLAAVIVGDEDHYIDHLAPLCALLDIPLYVVSLSIYQQVKRFYPKVNVCLSSFDQELKEMYLTKKGLISCYSSLLLDQIFFYCLISSPSKPTYIWCPHGNSEKGFNDYFEALLQKEDYILCYGPKVERQLQQTGLPSKPHRIPLGNYRFFYYMQEKSFLDDLLKVDCPTLFTPGKKVFYAPTWSTHLSSEEFKTYLLRLFLRCPPTLSLIVKLHPNWLSKYSVVISHLKEEMSSLPLHFMEKFPPIYPLLAQSDAYIGDRSSILFDALIYEIPLLLIDETSPFTPSLSSAEIESCFIRLDETKVDKLALQSAYHDAYYPFDLDELKKSLSQILYSSEERAPCNERREGMIVT